MTGRCHGDERLSKRIHLQGAGAGAEQLQDDRGRGARHVRPRHGAHQNHVSTQPRDSASEPKCDVIKQRGFTWVFPRRTIPGGVPCLANPVPFSDKRSKRRQQIGSSSSRFTLADITCAFPGGRGTRHWAVLVLGSRTQTDLPSTLTYLAP